MELPARFGKYELMERIATGGMAEVFLARSFGLEGFEKRLVIKRILPELARNPQIMNLFIQEAKVCAGLAHPNIVAVFELGRVADDPYIAMEYIHGRDLTRISRMLRERGETFPAPLAVFCVASVLRGLAYAHARTDAHGRPLGLVHRDVSPQNVLVTLQGEVKLVDFGIAHLEAGVSTGRAGKQGYMAPEQALGGPPDGRADVFSAGLVLYELLTGHRPWAQADPDERLRGLLEAGVPDPRPQHPEITDDLWEVLRRMLSVRVSERPSADLAEEDLRAWLFSHGLRADAAAMSGFLHRLLEDEDLPEPGTLGLRELAAEITRLAENAEPSDRPAARLGGGPEPLPGEQKPVVVLVGEITGLTESSAVLGTDVIVRRHFQIIRRIRRVSEQHGGTLNRYLDDTFVVFWGVQRADPHDLDRALAAAGALHRSIRQLAAKGLATSLSLGIHRGELALSRSRRRPDRYLARGDTMKLAQRLAAEAAAGQTLVSESVASGASERFAFSAPLAIRARGRAASALALLGRRAQPALGAGRWHRRGEELERLSQAFSSLARGQGGVLAILGEPGMGKSRLVREMQELARPRGVPFYAGRAEPFAEDLPFTPFRDLLSGMLGLEGSSDRPALLGRLDQVKHLNLNASDRALLRALYAPDPQARGGPTPEAMFATSARLVRGLAQQGPVVLAVEDVQNLDPTERGLVGHVIRACQGEPVLFLLTSSGPIPPELGPPTWEIHLEPLPFGTQARIVAELLAAVAVDEASMVRLAATAEGNALYLTELVNALRSAGRIVVQDGVAALVDTEGPLGLPLELESLLAARVDALEPCLKAVLQVASVLGLSFTTPLLAQAAGLADVDATTAALSEVGLLVAAWPATDGRIAFASPLVWEVVRRSILDGSRRELHGRVADAIARLHADNLDGHRQALATHCAGAGRMVEAARHAGRLGELLIQQQLLEEAASWWERGLGWIEAGEEANDRDGTQLLLRLHAGEARALLGHDERAMAHLEVAMDLAEEQADRWMEARALLALGRLYQGRGEAEMAQVHLEMVPPLCAAHPEDPEWRAVRVEALEQLGMVALDAGAHKEARRLCEEALSWAEDDDTLAARALHGVATALLHDGQERLAMDVLQRALDRAEAAGDRILSGRITNNMGIALLNAGRYSDALERFRRALEIREGLGYRRGAIVNLHNIGDAHLRAGEPGRAWAAFEQSRELASGLGWERGVVMNDVYLAFLEGMRAAGAWRGGESWDECTVLPDQAAAAADRLERASEAASGLGDLETSVNARGLLGRLLLQLGQTDRAGRVLEEALEQARKMNARALARDVGVALEPLRWAGEAEEELGV